MLRICLHLYCEGSLGQNCLTQSIPQVPGTEILNKYLPSVFIKLVKLMNGSCSC